MITPPNNLGRKLMKVNAMSQANLIALMLPGDMTCQELAEETGLHYVTVLQYVRELRRAKAAHVCRWDPDSRGAFTIAVPRIGAGMDAPRQPQPTAQRQATYRNRQRDARLLGLVS